MSVKSLVVAAINLAAEHPNTDEIVELELNYDDDTNESMHISVAEALGVLLQAIRTEEVPMPLNSLR